ncbi:DNA-binding transcriptional regulator Fis [Larsenimonas salina]|uniref:DNA-binding transcriptional regulator Fis n=1 Tax=Larsenimonas salina TaxID=1295565 RepID=UPI00207437BD|nr:DNA-binding transcriptional regulator Fis [Larsenimonas salina]MCM5703341.1 DNA-binding transcriptional regulator Fis [Larsenimonas salina]
MIVTTMNDASPAEAPTSQTLREAVETSMARYFEHLDGGNVTDLYAMVMAEVEAPLLQAVMVHTQGNQTVASQVLGLNRGTLRKKLKQYDLL